MPSSLSAILDHLEQDRDNALERLFDLLRIESVSTDPAYRPQCAQAADHCRQLLSDLGFEAKVHITEGQPMVLGHYRPASPQTGLHVLFYGHYDVQPPDPLDQWQTPPFEPVLGEDPQYGPIIIARGSSDDKGQFMTFLEAARATLKVSGDLPFRITVLLEGEEECGSPSLMPFLDAHRDELRADLAIVCDTNQWDAETPAITTMLRGLMTTEITVTGPSRDLHSGYYGGPARNPLQLLCNILAAARNADGKVLVPGFYDGLKEPATEQRQQWQALGFDEKRYLGEIGLSVPAGETDRPVLEQIWSRPTFEINGLSGGYEGPGVKTVIPSKATAKLSCRLVPGQDPQRILAGFKMFVEERLPNDCQVSFGYANGNPAIGFDTETAPFKVAAKALEDEFGRPALMMGCGASIPIVTSFATELGMNTLLIGFALEDDRIHSPNEKYNLSSYSHGCRAFARLIDALTDLDPAQLPPPPTV